MDASVPVATSVMDEGGFQRVEGVDAVPGDVAFGAARRRHGRPRRRGRVPARAVRDLNVIFAKAILEHIEKARLLEFIRELAHALAPDGQLVVGVRNMDWLLAAHEPDLELTHEMGFTRESLSTLLPLAFAAVALRGSRLAAPTRSQRLLRRPLVAILRRVLYLLGEGARDTLFESRSLLAVARAPRRAQP